jgi:hypothetical protein
LVVQVAGSAALVVVGAGSPGLRVIAQNAQASMAS